MSVCSVISEKVPNNFIFEFKHAYNDYVLLLHSAFPFSTRIPHVVTVCVCYREIVLIYMLSVDKVFLRISIFVLMFIRVSTSARIQFHVSFPFPSIRLFVGFSCSVVNLLNRKMKYENIFVRRCILSYMKYSVYDMYKYVFEIFRLLE